MRQPFLSVLCFFLLLAPLHARAQTSGRPGGNQIANLVRAAQAADISLEDLAAKLIGAAEKSPVFAEDLSRVQIQIPGFADVIAPLLSARLQSVLVSRSKVRTDGLKALTAKVLTDDNPRYWEIYRRATLIDNIDIVRPLLAAGLPDFESGEVQDQIAQRLSAGLKAQFEKGGWQQDPLDFLRRVAEFDIFWASGTTTSLAVQLLEAIGKEIRSGSFRGTEWPLDDPLVENFLQTLSMQNAAVRNAMADLYGWHVVELLKEDRGQQARFYFNRAMAFRQDPNARNTELRLAMAKAAYGESAKEFAGEQVSYLQEQGELGLASRMNLALRGYYGGFARLLILGVIVLILIFALACTAFMLMRPAEGGRRRRGPGYSQALTDSDDELSQLLGKFGLDESATDAQIKKAFRAAAKKYHPDAQGASGVTVDDQGNRDDTFEELHKIYDRIMEMRGGMFGGKKKE